MRFLPEFIERLKHQLPLSEVVGRRVSIKRQGREFHGLCPFHKEKSPSFTVNDEKSFFHCFGCGAHGDAIGFIKDYERVTYPEAVERLAGEAGLELPKITAEAQAAEKKRHTLEEVMALAERWFTEQLYAAGGNDARHYLRERGLRKSTADQFALGFAPNARDSLKIELLKQGIGETMLVEAGLLGTSHEGKSYDRFRARLMFPIRNAQGKTIAFGGRILPQAQESHAAKYLNSPETPLFKKGEILFAYDKARRAVSDADPLLVAEGYMDVIALHQAGFATAVAPLGTAITESQLRLLWRGCAEPVLCLDSDSAGMKAAMRAVEVALPLLKADHGLKFMLLPPGEDPDSLLRKSGAAAIHEALGRAKILSHTLWDAALRHFGAETAERKASLEHYLMQSVERIADGRMKQHMRSYFQSEIFALGRQKKGKKINVSDVTPGALPAADDDKTHIKRLEERLMALVLLNPDILHHGETEEHLGHMDFTQAGLDKLRAITLEVSAGVPSLDAMRLEQELASRGQAEKVETLLNSKNAVISTLFHAGLRDDPRAALKAFEQAYDAYTVKKLEHEKARMLEDDLTEASYERVLAIQKQIEIKLPSYSDKFDEQPN